MTETVSPAPITVPPPAELAELLSLLGSPEVLFAFIEHFGGTRIFIPRRGSDDSVVGKVVGKVAAERLAEAFGATELKVPLARHWRIRICHSWGWSYPVIARKFCITEKAVHGNLRAARLTGGPSIAAKVTRGQPRPAPREDAEAVLYDRCAAEAERAARMAARNERIREKLDAAAVDIARDLVVPLGLVNQSRAALARQAIMKPHIGGERKHRVERVRAVRERLESAIIAIANENAIGAETVWRLNADRVKRQAKGRLGA